MAGNESAYTPQSPTGGGGEEGLTGVGLTSDWEENKIEVLVGRAEATSSNQYSPRKVGGEGSDRLNTRNHEYERNQKGITGSPCLWCGAREEEKICEGGKVISERKKQTNGVRMENI